MYRLAAFRPKAASFYRGNARRVISEAHGAVSGAGAAAQQSSRGWRVASVSDAAAWQCRAPSASIIVQIIEIDLLNGQRLKRLVAQYQRRNASI